ncbi:uncharacterized protein [Montipora capricornis]|uniref:uncharacterized protein n=2 Tax=Montipora TaxID=46703 RepID=UPI0035F1EEC4
MIGIWQAVKAIAQLKQRDDIIITKPDKGSGVVIMDKVEYIRLLNKASIDDSTKFVPSSSERPKAKGRPPKYYHPLLEKEKLVNNAIKRILPKEVAESLLSQGSRLAHLYGLPKTHKKNLSVRPILSATGTYNFQLAKWLDEKLKPLSLNNHTITDVFEFAEEVTQLDFNENDILVSYDVTSLFTNVPLDETIEILATKAFRDNWFNKTNNLNITKSDLIELLELATKHQLFQYNGELYEQKDGVCMGSP